GRGPQLSADIAAIGTRAKQVVQLLPVGRKARQPRITFGSDLPLSACIVQPQRALSSADRSEKRLPVGSKRNLLFFGSAEGDLLRAAVGEPLTPDVIAI